MTSQTQTAADRDAARVIAHEAMLIARFKAGLPLTIADKKRVRNLLAVGDRDTRAASTTSN